MLFEMFAKETGSTRYVTKRSERNLPKLEVGRNQHLDGRSAESFSMTHYRVFLGAPSRAEMRQSPDSYQWQTVSSEPSPSASVIFPPATLEAASRRISLIYQGVIFKEPDEGEGIDEKMDLHGNGKTSS
jgi:hypothetical protein